MKFITILLFTIFLNGCVGMQQQNDIRGTIVGLQPFVGKTTSPNFTGGLVGAGVGGLLGNQIGKGNGKTLATVAGVGVGALAGSQVGKKTYDVNMIEILVQDSQGIVHRVQQLNNYGGWKINQQVKIVTSFSGKQEVTY